MSRTAIAGLVILVVAIVSAYFVSNALAHKRYYCGHRTYVYWDGTAQARARYLGYVNVGADHMHKYAHDRQKPHGGWYTFHKYWLLCNTIV